MVRRETGSCGIGCVMCGLLSLSGWNPERAHGLVRIPRWARLIVVSYLERVDTSYRKRAAFVAIPVERALQSVHFSLTFTRVTNPVGRSFAAYN